jgi:hypothetical protein
LLDGCFRISGARLDALGGELIEQSRNLALHCIPFFRCRRRGSLHAELWQENDARGPVMKLVVLTPRSAGKSTRR